MPDYQNCIETIKSPHPGTPNATLPNFPFPTMPEGTDPAPILQIPVDGGTILESGFSYLSSSYLIVNQWSSTPINGNGIFVMAGALQLDLSSGREMQTPLPGLLVVDDVSIVNGKEVHKSDRYFTPVRTGPVRIVESKGKILYLVASDGYTFSFDLTTRQYSVSPSEFSAARKAGGGTLFESSRIPEFASSTLGNYDIQNYWQLNEGNNVITIFAGGERANKHQPILVLMTSSQDTSAISEAVAYRIPTERDSLWIAMVDKTSITLVSRFGITIQFDLSTRTFSSLSVIAIHENASSIEAIELTPGAFPRGALPTDTPQPIPPQLPTDTPSPIPTSAQVPYP